MKRLVCLAAALCLFVSGALPSARAEITLPPDVMEHATEGINGVYSLDFDTAQKTLNSFSGLSRPSVRAFRQRDDCLEPLRIRV